MLNKCLHNKKTLFTVASIILIIFITVIYFILPGKNNKDTETNIIRNDLTQPSYSNKDESLRTVHALTPIEMPQNTGTKVNFSETPIFTITPEQIQTNSPILKPIQKVTPSPAPTPTKTPIPTPVPTQAPTSTPKTRVVGYYAYWAPKSGYTPDKIDGNKFTHINYAFANIGDDLRIAYADESVDISNFNAFKELKKKYPHLKTLISIGGWGWSGRFSDVALNEATRNTFADSCIDFIVRNGLDGIDIDWESPVSGGLPTNSARPEDKVNFTYLIRKLREKLDAQSAVDNKQYFLTIAGSADTLYIRNIELSVILNYLDYINLMTYDIHGPWNTYTDFNAPLYINNDDSPQGKWSVALAVEAWLNAGCPKQKLVVGMPFYGYKYSFVNNANNGLYQTNSGGYNVGYTTIASKYLYAPGYKRFFDSQSMVPWLFNGTTFITYEDEQSISLKAQFIKDNALGGAMIWELSQDPDEILLNSLLNGLK